jgi:nicotinamide mononucleotide transporter
MVEEINIFGQSFSILEPLAMLTGLAGVYLTIRQSPWCFPIGIINVGLYAYIFFSPGIQLYADALLQCIYILLLLFGWYRWTRKDIEKNDPPVKLRPDTGMKLLLIVFLCTSALGWFFENKTNASYPWLDSALTCGSLAAQWMIAKKILENWLVWIIVDVI